MNAHLLVIDDEPQIRRFLGISLTANGYRVSEADGATSGITAARDLKPDLVVLDLGLPDGDGQDVISAIRSFSDCPILILSVRADEFDKVEALDRGANDYMVKPFGIAELMARLRALLRSRSPGPSNDSLSLGPVSLSMTRRVIRRDGEEIHLSKRGMGSAGLSGGSPGSRADPPSPAAQRVGPGPCRGYGLSAGLHRTAAAKAGRGSGQPPVSADRTGDRLSPENRRRGVNARQTKLEA